MDKPVYNITVNIPELKGATFADANSNSKPNIDPALKKLLVQVIKGQ